MSLAIDSLFQPVVSIHQLVPAMPLASFMGIVLGWLMAFLSVFLILLILIQRGKGGGLTGALGGPGGQSAFGSKAGDTFTAITVGTAAVWALVCAFAMYQLGAHAPKVANTNDSSLSAGPGGEADDDITSGLVVPTNADEADSDDDSVASGVGSIGGLSSGDSDSAEGEASEEAETATEEVSAEEATSDEETP